MFNAVRLNGNLIDRLRAEAKRRGVTLVPMIEEALEQWVPREVLAPRSAVSLPECVVGGGTYAGVDLRETAAVLERVGAQN